VVPKVTDFGLARMRESGLSVTGEALGTPSYMPPEQARGQVKVIGPRSDVYGLGAVLYCLLTGRPPFQSSDPVETMCQVCTDEPVPPGRLQPKVPRDLETICLKCLQKDPARRYASARDLADDLRRFQNGEGISARPVGMVERGVKWARRRPAVASLLAALLALALTSAVLVGWQYHEAITERNNAIDQERIATEEKRYALDQETIAKTQAQIAADNAVLAQGKTRLANDQTRIAQARLFALQASESLQRYPQAALLLASQAVQHTRAQGEPILPAAEQVLRNVLSEVRGRGLSGHRQAITRMEISPDGRWLATASRDATLRLWDLKATDPASKSVVVPVRGEIKDLAFDPRGRWLAALPGVAPPVGVQAEAGRATVLLWDLRATDLRARPRVARIPPSALRPGSRWGLFFSPDGARLCLTEQAGQFPAFTVWDLNREHPFAEAIELLPNKQRCQLFRHSPGGRWLLTVPEAAPPADRTKAAGDWGNPQRADLPMHLWDLTAKDVRASRVVVRAAGQTRLSARFSPNERWLITIATDGAVRRWDLQQTATKKEPTSLAKHEGEISKLAISPDGRWLAALSVEGALRLWDLTVEDSLQPPLELSKTVRGADHFGFSADSRRLLVAEPATNATLLWDLQTKALTRLQGRIQQIHGRWVEIKHQTGQTVLHDLTLQQAATISFPLQIPAPDNESGPSNRFGSSRQNPPDAYSYISPDQRWLVKVANRGSYISPDQRWLVKVANRGTILLWELLPRAGKEPARAARPRRADHGPGDQPGRALAGDRRSRRVRLGLGPRSEGTGPYPAGPARPHRYRLGSCPESR
jgi:WD40 repeat protein